MNLRNVLKREKEVVMYYDMKDLMSKIEYYLQKNERDENCGNGTKKEY